MEAVVAWREGGSRPGPGGEDSRGRLIRLGAQALTDRELLRLLCDERGGPLPEALLDEGLRALAQHDPYDLAGFPGVGPVRAAQLLAALELGRRLQGPCEKRPRLRTPHEIYRYLAPRLASLRKEVFHVLCFNGRNVLLRDLRIAEGSASTCPVDPREVFQAALGSRASAIVLAHNHPSGEAEPSDADLALTRQLCAGAQLLGLSVLDHLVVGDGVYTSMLERNLLPRQAA
jgi:DNA repair protein RadC